MNEKRGKHGVPASVSPQERRGEREEGGGEGGEERGGEEGRGARRERGGGGGEGGGRGVWGLTLAGLTMFSAFLIHETLTPGRGSISM